MKNPASFEISQPSYNSDPIAGSYSIGETELRNIFISKESELFLQPSAELERLKAEYRERFRPKQLRRDARFAARLSLAGGKYENISAFEFREFGRKGFPRAKRHLIFAHLLRLSDFEAKYGVEYFGQCLQTDIPSSIGRVIQVDIPRTLSFFVSTCGEKTKGILMKMLRDVLWAFAVHKPEIGYCQSMNFIAAYFLSVFGSAKSSFYALVQLIDSPTNPYVGLHIPGYYAPGMSQLLVDIEVLELFTRSRVGSREYEVFFERREISNLSMIVSEWFHTLFVTVFPIRTVDRVFDFMLTGTSNKSIFRIACTVLKDLSRRKKELIDLDSVMQGHKRITKLWVDGNQLVVASTRGLRMFTGKRLELWRSQVREVRRNDPQHHSAQPVGNTMMKLEEAIATQNTLMSVPPTLPEEGAYEP